MTTRRSFITGLISLVAAPAIVRAGSLMPVKAILPQSHGFLAIGTDAFGNAMVETIQPWNNRIAADLNEQSLLQMMIEVRKVYPAHPLYIRSSGLLIQS